MTDPLCAGVELGGTKLCLVLGRGCEILRRERLDTRTPGETLGRAAGILAEWRRAFAPTSLGIASFGPIAVDREDPRYGQMLATPKPGWAGADVVGILGQGFAGRVALHTDVTAAALAEGEWGAARGLRDHVYVTIGTGIGMGVIASGRPIAGAMHPEAGHVLVRRLPDDPFAGACPFHADCLEGLASGPAIAARAGHPGETLSAGDPAWTFVADALAQAFAGLFLSLGTQRIVVGGGVGIGQAHILPRIRARVVELLAGYLPFIDEASAEQRIVTAEFGADAGPLGALLLARSAAAS